MSQQALPRRRVVSPPLIPATENSRLPTTAARNEWEHGWFYCKSKSDPQVGDRLSLNLDQRSNQRRLHRQ